MYFWKRRGRQEDRGAMPPPPRRPVEDMVRCKICSVNLPRSEAIMSQGRFYCCDEHRRAEA
ncbi:MAG TPA: PP0621 family protein [Thiobacillaceae bacterium]|nr:PP0621 family protein [Thiobacillaceae bacterium]